MLTNISRPIVRKSLHLVDSWHPIAEPSAVPFVHVLLNLGLIQRLITFYLIIYTHRIKSDIHHIGHAIDKIVPKLLVFHALA